MIFNFTNWKSLTESKSFQQFRKIFHGFVRYRRDTLPTSSSATVRKTIHLDFSKELPHFGNPVQKKKK